ncbi:MAG: hypothetical protein CVU33_07775 [Betaproteobacteria bacterium HGW-Betaproteobacteria-6]|nr:MAG: hypothetical protein CVU33_07775 [Betaproteobacteria bacterium HGW-Betaproteobacteria-6]
MFFLRHTFAATLVAAFFGAAQATETAEQQFAAIARLPADKLGTSVGQTIEVDIDLAAGGSLDVKLVGERMDVLYRMAFNQIAEGWNWHPLADPAVDDYYRFKFLPLQSVAVERGEYLHEDKIGSPQQMKVVWRYDYFLAFANLYDFYPRSTDDNAGFSANLPAALAGHVGMRARARLIQPVISESTTFWKATYGKPTDFTLKKRYLVATLEEVAFIDTASGEVLCRIEPGQGRCTGR